MKFLFLKVSVQFTEISHLVKSNKNKKQRVNELFNSFYTTGLFMYLHKSSKNYPVDPGRKLNVH